MTSIGAEANIVHPARMLDGGFFLPLIIDKPPEFGSPCRGCDKTFSVGAEPGLIHHEMLAKGFFLPPTGDKLPDFGAEIPRDRHKTFTVRAEANILH